MSKRKRLCSENQIKKRTLTSCINDLIERYPETPSSPSDIKTIIDKYRELNACYSKFERNSDCSFHVLYCIVDIMYRSRFQDSSYVEKVLHLIYKMNKEMKIIIFPTGFKFPSLRGVETDDFVQYFLEHAYMQKVLFDGYRLPCSVYLSHGYHSGNWSMLDAAGAALKLPLLHQMLRFGAMFSYGKNYRIRQTRHSKPPPSVPNYPLFSTIFKMLEINPELLSIENVKCVDVRHRRYEKLASCCKLLLKEFSMSSVDELHAYLRAGLRYNWRKCPEKETVIDCIKKFSANVIEDFQNHFIMTLSLKQISRLVIRRELNSNWALPEGIYQLNIPEILKIYIDV